MRLAAACLLLLSMVMLACAAFLGPGKWQPALYGGVIVWALTLVVIVAAVAEALAPERSAWTRAALALLAGGAAVAISLQVRPGALEQYPFHDVFQSARSIAALGLAAAGFGLGVAAVRLNKRVPMLLGGLAVFLAAFALRGWLRGG